MGDNGTVSEPEVVHIDSEHVRMSPQAMRMLTAATGRTLEQLMDSEESADKFQALAFVELHRRHRDVGPAELWEMAGDVEVELTPPAADPFGTGSSTLAPRLPTTGDYTPT
jgi:hypothetical protein